MLLTKLIHSIHFKMSRLALFLAALCIISVNGSPCGDNSPEKEIYVKLRNKLLKLEAVFNDYNDKLKNDANKDVSEDFVAHYVTRYIKPLIGAWVTSPQIQTKICDQLIQSEVVEILIKKTKWIDVLLNRNIAGTLLRRIKPKNRTIAEDISIINSEMKKLYNPTTCQTIYTAPPEKSLTLSYSIQGLAPYLEYTHLSAEFVSSLVTKMLNYKESSLQIIENLYQNAQQIVDELKMRPKYNTIDNTCLLRPVYKGN